MWVWSCVVVCVSLMATWAHAGTLDEVGGWVPEGDAQMGFTAQDLVESRVFGLNPGDAPQLVLKETPEALEGESVLEVGGPGRVDVFLRLDAKFERFVGRRVRFTIWTQPRGTDALVSVEWFAGNRDVILAQGPGGLTELGELRLLPTGRVTDDGWVELSSGEVDFAIGGQIPATLLVVSDGRFPGRVRSLNPLIDPEDRAWVDGFEVHDVGPAAVPDAACTALDEEQVCGEHGTCLFGRCADAAALWGAPPIPEQRGMWMSRLYTMFNMLEGARHTRALGDVLSTWNGLADVSVRDYWKSYMRGLFTTRDSHVLPMLVTRPWKAVGGGGICLGPGEADLLPGAPSGPALMVFREHTGVNNALTQGLQPGDVLDTVDGIPWAQWVESVPMYAILVVDPDEAPHIKARRIMNAALTTGATVTFKRCSSQDAQACTAQEVETLTLDLSKVYGDDIWQGRAAQGNLLSYWCDWRFDSRTSYDRNTGNSVMFATALNEGVRHITFNSFPRPSTRWGAGAVEAFTGAPPEGFLLDMRLGQGGELGLLFEILSRFLPKDSNLGLQFYPWVPDAFEETMRARYDTCESSEFSCNNYVTSRRVQDPGANFPQTPLALVTGYNASAHDMLLRVLGRERVAPTRSFGYAASLGSFGQLCSLPRMMGGEVRPLQIQCSDIQLQREDGTRTGYLSGQGFEPDERVYQKQSDALQGVDTVLARAEAWLQEQIGGNP